jgi:hypothetical protein
MKRKYLYTTVEKGVAPKDITLLLTQCFGEEHNSPKYNCFYCQVRRKCRYVHNKGLKPKLLEKHKDQIKAKILEKEQSEKHTKQKEVVIKKKELLKGILLSEKILKKRLKEKNKPFKIDKSEIKKELFELKKSKRVLEKFFKDN